jgi:hypothetical protein
LAVAVDAQPGILVRDVQTAAAKTLRHSGSVRWASWSFDAQLLSVSCSGFNVYV